MIALWNQCRFWLLFHYCLFVNDCTVKSLPFFTTFFTFVRLCMIALWNHCRFYIFFYYCLLVYDSIVKSLPFFTTFSLLSVCVWLHCEITAVFDYFFTLVRLCMIALWNHCRFWPRFHFCPFVYDCIVKSLPFLQLFHYCLLVYDCIVKSLPFFTTFSLLSVCVWLHCKITAIFDHFYPIVCLCKIAL